MRAATWSSPKPTRQWALGFCLLAGLLAPCAWAQTTASVSRVQITSSAGTDDTYAIGDVIVAQATFTEPVWVTNSPSLTLALTTPGTVEALYRNGSGSRVLRFEYTVRRGDVDGDGVSIPSDAITLGAADGIVDRDGDAATLTHDALAADEDHQVDGVAPQVTAIAAVSPAGAHVAGDYIDFDVTFDDDIIATGNVDLVVTLGATSATLGDPPTDPQSRRAELIVQPRQSGRVLRFRYIVQAGDQDSDGISVEPDALSGGTIRDATGNPADRTMLRTTWATHTVDAAPPAVIGVDVTSRPRSGDTYRAGETIDVGVTFDEEVYVTGNPRLAIGIDSRTQQAAHAAYISGSGTRTLTFSYTVQAGDRDDDGISIAPDALTGGTIEDAAGTDFDIATRRITPLPALGGHKVDGGDVVTVSVSSPRVTSSPASGTSYQTGEVIRVAITFSARVFVAEEIDEPDPIDLEPLSLLLAIGEHSRAAAFESGSGTPTLTFRYIVAAEDYDDAGISIPPGRTSLQGGVIEDADGNLAPRNFPGVASLTRHRVNAGGNGVPPRVESVTIRPRTGRQPYPPYGPGERIEVDVTFSERVYVSEAADELELLLSIGTETRAAHYLAGSGTTTLRFRYVVQATDRDDDGISIGPGVSVDDENARTPGSLVGGVIEDADGNLALRDFQAKEANRDHRVGSGVEGPPAIDEVAISSFPGAGNPYRPGDPIEVTITFSETVFVVEQPLQLMLSIGPNLRPADYQTGSGSDRLVFRYVTQAGDQDDDGISIGPGPGSLVGGPIQDTDGNDASRDFAALPAQEAHKVAPQPAAAPTIQITSDPEGPYRAGDAIEVTVTFPETVFVVRQPLQVMLSIGPNLRAADYQRGSGSNQLEFRYVVQADDQDDDGVSIGPGPGALAGGAIQDEDGNDAPRNFAALPADPQHKVGSPQRAAMPTAQIITRGPYRPGDAIEVRVTFPETVFVVQQPLRLMLSIGPNLRAADYQTGSGTPRLVFRYVVQAGDQDDDGVSIGPGPGALAGGPIQHADGGDAPRDFAALPPDPRHKVGPTPPIAQIETQGPYRPGDAIEVTVTFPETVFVVRQPLQLMLSIGPNLRAADYQRGSGSNQLVFRYVVQAGDQDDDGVSIGPGPGALAGGAIQDADGNDAPRDFAALPANGAHKVGSQQQQVAAPTVAITSSPDADDTYRSGEAIQVTVTFSTPVFVSGSPPPAVALLIGPDRRLASYARGSGTNELIFRYTVQRGDRDENGISIGPGRDALTGGVIEDEQGNAAVRDFVALRDDEDHMVAGGPSATGVAITSSPATGDTYAPGEDIVVAVTFDGAVRVTDRTRLKLTLRIGERLRNADFIGGSGTSTLRFRYTVQHGDQDVDGISIDPMALVNGGVTDAAGSDAAREFEELPDQRGHKVGAAVVVTAALDRLMVGGAPRQVPLGTLLTQTGLSYRGGFAEPEVDTPNVVDATLAGAPGQPILTVSAIAEGTANIVVTARNAAITLIFTVSVGADAAEAAVLEDALASVGRGLLSSASDVIGGRLRPDRAPSEQLVVPNRRGYPRRPPSHFAGQGGAAADNGSDSLRWLSAAERLHPDPNNPQRGMAAEQLLSMLAFDMPFLGERGGSTGFSFWGAGDMRRFSGDPEEGGYDGDLAVAYLGIDARGGDWVAGAAVAHSRGDANYDAITANGKIEGTLETELTAFHPYAQWRLNDRAEAWAIFGFGQGEATHTRKDLGYVDAPSDLTMAMGLAGARGILGSGLGFDLALHGDAGMIRLETADDGGALDELSLSMQRARVGVEAAYPLALAGGRYSIAPFLDVAARYDGGDGQTGAGIEVAAGVRYDGPIVSFEAKARSLVWHGADGYSESGASAAIVVEPGSQDGRGLRLSLAPRWGGASNSMDVFWRHSAFGAQRGWRSAAERGWGLGGRVSYGFGLSTLPGAITPFADFDFAGATRRSRLGVGYGVSSPWGVPLRIDLSGERMEDERGADHRFLLSGEALF